MNSNLWSSLVKLDATELDNESLQKAQREIGETPEKRMKCLRTLREKLLSVENLYPCTDELFLLRFLRVSKFDVTKAYDRIIKYYRMQQKYPKAYERFYPSATYNARKARHFLTVPYRTKDNTVLFIHKRGDHDPSTVAFDEVLRLNTLVVEECLLNPITQMCGFTLLVDLQMSSLDLLTDYPPTNIKIGADFIKNTFIARFSSIHVINAPTLYYICYNMLYPLLSSKIRKRIIIHPNGDEWKSLHAHIPPEILPREYGGYLDSSSVINLSDKIHDHEDYFRKQTGYGFGKKESAKENSERSERVAYEETKGLLEKLNLKK